MSKIQFKLNELTASEWALVAQVAIGCTELSSSHLRRFVRASQSQTPLGKKYDVGDFLFFFLLEKCREPNRQRIVMRTEIKHAIDKHFDNRISTADVARELGFLERLGLIERSKGPAKLILKIHSKKWRPEKISGPKYYIHIDSCLCKSQAALANPQVQAALFGYLTESGVIPRYLIHSALALLHVAHKKSSPVEELQEVYRPYLGLAPYDSLKKLMNAVKGRRERDLKSIASRWVDNFLRTDTLSENHELLSEFYLRGLLHFNFMQARSGLP